ncbi:MAG TPA: RDD family protein [Candidatus Baltobacteraceae bacterium]|nr:RDD family protein [Candidatus Baltobacteraceae bacterium]
MRDIGAARIRSLVTPEGVPLLVERADLSERATAFAIDYAIISFAVFGVLLLAVLAAVGHVPGGSELVSPAAVFVTFLIRNAYFVAFEVLWGGATPGKRRLGLRVVSRDGGPLTVGALVARNLSREVETFFPLGLMIAARAWSHGPWDVLALAAWLLLGTLLPLCNRDALRAGDIVGGTLVIAMPKRMLLEDLGERKTTFSFTDEQLQRYGIRELQVLEDLLRRPESPAVDELLYDVTGRVCKRIGWTNRSAIRDVRAFLGDFYTAQRAFLETRKHLGEERADKHFQPPAKR